MLTRSSLPQCWHWKGGDYGCLRSIARIEGLVKCPVDLNAVEVSSVGAISPKVDYHRRLATAIHQVLGSKSGWNWAIVHSLYPNVEVYTRHLRALEEFTKKHPDDGPARFLQAYHYKVGGHT